MKHPENNTIEAINQLKEDFPYAASMLIYVVIERELKSYVLKNRKTLKTLENKFKTKDDKEFIKRYLTNLTMWQLVNILGIGKKLSDDRNNLMHSNLYIKKESPWPDDKRHEKNKEHFETAKEHLIRIFEQLSNYRIIEKDGQLSISDH